MQGKRPRIQPRVIEKNTVEDEQEFKKNKCTERGRKIVRLESGLAYDLWYDQHYIITRHQHGEDNGKKRPGINPEVVEPLIRKSLGHLVYYGSRVKGFSFLNHDNHPTTRIVLQDSTEGETLNVVVEVHFIDLYIYEITVKTAMRKDDFRIDNGKFVIQFFNDHHSMLKRQDGMKETELSELVV